MNKIIVVYGGVYSSVGKGIITASLARVTGALPVKIDPYLNIDAGTLAPREHGEVYVTIDGAETDLDIGTYERFTGRVISKESSITMGQVYQSVLTSEREGKYGGRTVQTIPHVTTEIQRRILQLAIREDVVVEVGGTIGDLESDIIFKALSLLSKKYPVEFILVAPLVTNSNGSIKTKPLQRAIDASRTRSIEPNRVYVRHSATCSKKDVLKAIEKTSSMTGIPDRNFISIPDVEEVTEVVEMLGGEPITPSKPERYPTEVGIVGKYTDDEDSYLSLIKQIEGVGAVAKLITSVDDLVGVDALVIPGGFGDRGIELKTDAVRCAIRYQIPILGICLGMQLMICEMTGLAHGEFSSDPDAIVKIMPEHEKTFGGGLRLGSKATFLEPDSRAMRIYGENVIYERYRHRYDVSTNDKALLEAVGLRVTGVCRDNTRVQIVEIPEERHPFFMGVQFHPEFGPHINPIFKNLIGSVAHAC